MATPRKASSLFQILLILTLLSIFAQIVFVYVHSLNTNMLDNFISNSITAQVFHSRVFFIGLFAFLGSQCLVYALCIYALWYVTLSVAELLTFNARKTYWLGIFFWIVTALCILAANTYYSPNSFFSVLARENIFKTYTAIELTLAFTTLLIVCAITASFANLIIGLYRQQQVKRHKIVLIFIGGFILLAGSQQYFAKPFTGTEASAEHPNVIIIGIDAVRPDFIGYYQHNKTAHTPTVDAFLNSSIRFSNATATLARTFPSWSSILTSALPFHNHARGNNTILDSIDVSETLPKEFKKAGYETLYGTDDTRFNNTNELFGFDHLITPPMGLNDFLFGSLNDFPLSNLIIPTPLGKLLFPYNFANHGTPITYTPNNFLQLIQDRLHERSSKPIFMAVHFTLSHWPFYWFNDKQPLNNHELTRYAAAITATDAQVSQFLKILQQNKLLDHAIVVLISDHGTSLGLPGDRNITAINYQGDKINIKKIPVSHYCYEKDKQHAAFHLDTSYGYGSDILSFVQFHTLLAFKGYGVKIGEAHQIDDRVSLMDIGPTLFALLDFPAQKHADGISLKPYLSGAKSVIENRGRHFFLETSYSIDEIQKETINVSAVLRKALKFYEINLTSGLIYIKPEDEKIMNYDKEFGVLQGDWLLAKYPQSERSRLALAKNNEMISESYTLPSYYVLVNLKTGAWTTELNTSFARTAPTTELLQALHSLYGAELNGGENPVNNAKKPLSA